MIDRARRSLRLGEVMRAGFERSKMNFRASAPAAGVTARIECDGAGDVKYTNAPLAMD